jgi:L-fuculose-phosphate aldolase
MSLSAAERQGVEAIRDASRSLVAMDLLELGGGNISIRLDDQHMLITRHHVNKAVPTAADIVRTAISTDDEFTNLASSAWLVHREIYARTDAKAIIHAHGQQTVTVSFFFDSVEPIDENGLLLLGACIPVVAAPQLFAWNLAAEAIGEALVTSKIVVEKWHGTFAKGVDLVDALHRTRGMEFAAGQIIRVAQLRPFMPEPTFPPTEVAEWLGGIYRPGIRRNVTEPT